MSDASSVEELKQAILKQANEIAAEYHERAKTARDNIMQEARERLHLREEHETKVARVLADKEYARRIQGHELRLHRKLDMLRWNLVQSVLNSVKDEFIKYMQNDYDAYIETLGKWTSHACKLMSKNVLIAEVNQHDHQYMKDNWDSFAEKYVPEKVQITLALSHCETLGGIRIRTPDNTMRVDNCFEGRMQRLEPELQQCIMHKLFSTVEQIQQLIHK